MQFTEFHPNVHEGKTFAVFASSVHKIKVLKKAIAQLKLHWENFHDSSKIKKAAKFALLYLIKCIARYVANYRNFQVKIFVINFQLDGSRVASYLLTRIFLTIFLKELVLFTRLSMTGTGIKC